jgi:simple sugar transport system substrate-binding protein
MWQDPQATSYLCLSSLLMEGDGIPLGFDIITGALYEKDTAMVYHTIMGGK